MSGDEPIQIESDKLEVREKENMAIFSGNVSVVQGPTLLKAGKLTVFYVKGTDGSATAGTSAIDHLEVDGQGLREIRRPDRHRRQRHLRHEDARCWC